jgi:hypothetical protein
MEEYDHFREFIHTIPTQWVWIDEWLPTFVEGKNRSASPLPPSPVSPSSAPINSSFSRSGSHRYSLRASSASLLIHGGSSVSGFAVLQQYERLTAPRKASLLPNHPSPVAADDDASTDSAAADDPDVHYNKRRKSVGGALPVDTDDAVSL